MEKGREEGRVEGRVEERKEIVARMLKQGMDLKTASELTGLSIADLTQLQ